MIDLPSLMQHCAPAVAPTVLEAIIRTESGFDPLALHVNGAVRLQSQPRTLAQAGAWSDWLIRHGYSVDMGLMQINSRNLTALHLTATSVFQPCLNLRAGAAILSAYYSQAAQAVGAGTPALLRAISAYNTGTFTSGFRNGYVGRVVLNIPAGLRPVLDLTCLLTRCETRSARLAHPSPYTADSAVAGFDSIP